MAMFGGRPAPVPLNPDGSAVPRRALPGAPILAPGPGAVLRPGASAVTAPPGTAAAWSSATAEALKAGKRKRRQTAAGSLVGATPPAVTASTSFVPRTLLGY